MLTPLRANQPVMEFLLAPPRVGLIEPRLGWGGHVRVSEEAKAAGWGKNVTVRKVRGGAWRFPWVPI